MNRDSAPLEVFAKHLDHFLHDFNGHAGTILAAVELMERRMDSKQILDPKFRRTLQHIRTAARMQNHRMQGLFHLNFDQLSSPQNFETGALVQFVMDMVPQLKKRENISLHYLLKEGLPLKLNGHEDEIVLVLQNLLTNGFFYTDEGKVEISMGVAARHGKQGVEFCVRDTGPGIAEKDLPHIFNAGFRGDKHRKTRAGQGLGLTIVKKLVHQMQGEISVQSDTSDHRHGTTFTVFLPLTPVGREHLLGDISGQHHNFSSDIDEMLQEIHDMFSFYQDFQKNNHRALRVLVVEDDPVTALLTGASLERLGTLIQDSGVSIISVSTVQTGAAAVECAGRHDIIFMDIELPDMNGDIVTTKIREQDLDPMPDIYALTSMRPDRIKENLFVEIFTKPFQPQYFAAALQYRIQRMAARLR